MKQFYLLVCRKQVMLLLLCTCTALSTYMSGAYADAPKKAESKIPSSTSVQQQNTNSPKAHRPKPTFFEQTRKLEEERKRKGFAANFLVDALNGVADPLGGIGGSGTGGFSAEFQGKSNILNTSGNPQTVSNGIFTKTGDSSVNFIGDNGSQASFTGFDTSDPVNVTTNGQTYSSRNFGFSKDSAFAAFDTGGQSQVYRVDGNARDTFDDAPVGTSFSGVVVTGGSAIPDR
jgi:hypothetical protein